ncbi:hypothetical protein O6H91_13G102400 [Diphasiastrum complanatum]|uniref:Uncharacterized protein n=1 Tax=Diphasiastrum complanatum TaxID=34168 RepID=A0ACC2BYD1_DIPCM|nr:hypothetical protein O6H91_13G102400 [Diphasiastrum complanatum]
MASSGICMVCGSMGMGAGGDGFFYCITCGSQSQTLQEQDLDDFEDARMLHVREANVSRKLEQDAAIIAFQQQGAVGGGHADPLLASAFSSQAEQETLLRIISQNSTQVASAEEQLRNRIAVASQYGGTAGVQFWSLSQTDEPAVVLQRMGNQFRETYVSGVQRILQMQCEALVEQFGVSPLICGIAGPIWLRFLASTHVFEKEWADEAIQLAEVKKITKQDEHCGDADPDIRTPKNKPDVQTDRKKFLRRSSFKEPMTSNGLRITSVWLAAIKERIPLTVTLAISFLACHIAREPVLPTDITKWALEGVLPYLAAFLKVDMKFNDGQYAPPDLLLSNLDSKRMFKPMRMISARMVEFLAAHIAVRVGLELPPVNFYALSCRFLKELDLPVEKLATYVCRLYEWYCPSNLWLEAREDAFPSRVFVMAMILITIKILYKLDGGNISGQSFNSQLETQKKDEAYFRLFHDKSNLESRPTKDAEMTQFRNQDQAKDKGAIGDADTQHREKNIPMSNGGILNANFDIEEWNAKEIIGNLERSLLKSNSPSVEYDTWMD